MKTSYNPAINEIMNEKYVICNHIIQYIQKMKQKIHDIKLWHKLSLTHECTPVVLVYCHII